MYFVFGKRAQQCYDIGDNDYYWSNSHDTQLFYVIPENILVEKVILDTPLIKINSKQKTHNVWIQSYKFNYNQIGLFEKRHFWIFLIFKKNNIQNKNNIYK